MKCGSFLVIMFSKENYKSTKNLKTKQIILRNLVVLIEKLIFVWKQAPLLFVFSNLQELDMNRGNVISVVG